MKFQGRTFLLLCLLCTLNLIRGDDEDLEDDVPVIQGNGGVIATAVEDDVLILTSENFDLQLAGKDIILVEFYAPWCGHCKSLAPEYAKAAKILKDADPPVALAKVDATVETELAARYEVTGYPTLFLFKKGEKIPYEGPRTAMGIVEYVKERSDPNWRPPPEAVITLTRENFTEAVRKADIMLVEFYAPWCGHCKHLAPEYERAAKVLKDLPVPIPLAKVDGTVEKELADQYEARGWPTLMIFRKGQKFAYEGPRDEPGIISYMKEQAKPASREVKSSKEIESSLAKQDSTVVGFFTSDTDPLYVHFQESGNVLRGKFLFLHSFSQKLMKQWKLEKSSIVFFHPEIYTTEFQPSRFVFDKADASATDITHFIQSHLLPLVGERNQKSRWKYDNKYPLVVVYYDVDFSFDHRIHTQRIRKEVARVAKDYRGRITFAVSKEEDHEEELVRLGLGDSGEDVNAGFYESERTRYAMEPVEEFSAEELKSFVEGVLAGRIQKHVQSQPVPKDNRGPVVTVVGSTFDNLVTRSERDVLLEFYAPWCGHCKKLEPVYKRLGRAFSGQDSRVVIAKIDATANDFPTEFAVSGFPTIYYVRPKSGPPILYEGDRSFEDLKRFVEKQLANEAIRDEL